MNIQKIRKAADKFFYAIKVQYHLEDAGNQIYLAPSTRGHRKFEGMQLIFDKRTETFEVSEYQAGPKAEALYIYGEYKTPAAAIRSLIKGNGYGNRTPKQVW